MVNIPKINRPIKWYRDNNCKYMMTKTINDILNKHNIKKSTNNDSVLYLPCTYNNINKEVNSMKPIKNDQRFFVVNNADELTSKNKIWKNLVDTYGRDIALTIMPTTYILSDPNDIALFQKEYNKNQIYILKKNIQRQKGLKITKDKNVILNANKNGYVIVQKLLQNPYKIDGRKINMRFYVLFICHNNEISAYVHNEGFMYYTKTKFVKNSITEENNITTGYIDRAIYEKNPLTLGDLKKYLDNYNRLLNKTEISIINSGINISDYVFSEIHKLLYKVVYAVKNTICVNSHLKSNITFQLFGADVSLSDTLIPQLMEINKGPDLGTKDKRDSIIKHSVIEDIFKLLKVLPNKNNGFIKIYE